MLITRIDYEIKTMFKEYLSLSLSLSLFACLFEVESPKLRRDSVFFLCFVCFSFFFLIASDIIVTSISSSFNSRSTRKQEEKKNNNDKNKLV